MKRYSGNILLIELIFTLLFFSLSMMVILQLFADAQQKANDSVLLNGALSHARNTAELLSHEDNPDTQLLELGFIGGNGNYVYSDTEGYDLAVSLEREEYPAGQLIKAIISASDEDEILFELPVDYYIAGEVGAQ